MTQQTCRLITVVNSILVSSRTGNNQRLFKPQEQFEYTGPFRMGQEDIITSDQDGYMACDPCYKYYVVACDDHEYEIPERDVVESTVAIPMASRDFEKARNEQILIDPNNSYKGTVARPCPEKILEQANIVRFEI